METALDKRSGDVVDASQLWIIDNTVGVDKGGYKCRGCGVTATPCSYGPHNKVRPYFRAEPNHQKNCDIPAEEELIKRGRTKRLTTLEGFPGSAPNRLRLKDQRPTSDPAGLPAAPRSRGPNITTTCESSEKQRQRFWEANTIRPICRTFINYPYDRDLPLKIPGSPPSTYQYSFRKIENNQIIEYPETRVFYAPTYWGKYPETDVDLETDTPLEIKLGCGVWTTSDLKNGSKSRLTTSYRVKIHWEDWSKAQRNFVLKEINTAIRESQKALDKGNKNIKGWLFFIGEQDTEDLSVFHVKDHRLICCIAGELIYPMNKGYQKKNIRRT